MKRIELQDLTVDQLVERFVDLALAQDHANDMDDIRKYNRLFPQMEDVRYELQTRPGNPRRALLPLLEHPSAQVRFLAAITVAPVEPEAARRALQLMWDRNEYPQAADAYSAIRAIDNGRTDNWDVPEPDQRPITSAK